MLRTRGHEVRGHEVRGHEVRGHEVRDYIRIYVIIYKNNYDIQRITGIYYS
jgi:hypothetical protein